MRNGIKFFLVLVALLVWMIHPAAAQNSPEIQSLKVDLWPEYDQQAMLVIYRFTLSPETSLPVQLSLPIPAAAGDPHAVAVGATEQLVADVPFTRQVSGEQAEVTFTASMPVVQFEYYDPNIQKQGEQRRYEYTWPGIYTVDFLVVEVQQPAGATDMTVSPALDASETRSDGLTYYTSQIGALPEGQPFTMSIEYRKTSDTLSVNAIDVQPSKPIDEDTIGRVAWNDALPWALGAIGLILLVGGGLWYWQSGRKEARPASRRRRGSTRPRPAAIEAAPAEGSIYCHQCGNRAGPNDRFCRSCGTRLRMES